MKNESSLRLSVLLPMALYGIGMTLILLLQGLVGERWTPVAFLNTFAQLLWLPALCLLPLTLLTRAWRTSLLLVPAALAWIITFGDHFIPKPPPSIEPEQTSFTFMSYNLLDNQRDPQQAIAVIRATQPDIVAMQELNPRTAYAFNTHLADEYPYQAFHSEKGRFRGLGVMSKYPLSDDLYWDYDWMPVSLGHQRIRIEIEGQMLTLFNLHPVHPGMQGRFFDPTLRNREIAALMDEASAEQAPFMMNGDFNMPELSDDYHRITQDYGFIDAYREQGWGLGHTFTHHVVPFLRLDYIFLGDDVDVADIQVWPNSGGSDHRPVVGRFILR